MLDPDAITTELEPREVLRHEACHVATLSGARCCYARERLRHADLHTWYVELNRAKFAGELPDATVFVGRLESWQMRRG
jgi:hypothetical protein